MRRKRLLPDPDGPVMAAHAPVPRFSSNGPANALWRSLTRSAVSIEFPCLQRPCLRFPAPTIETIAILERLLRKLPLREESRQRSGITRTRNFDVDHVDAGRRLALPELFGRGHGTQAKECPPRTQAMARRPGTSIRCNSRPSRLTRMKASSSKDATHTASS